MELIILISLNYSRRQRNEVIKKDLIIKGDLIQNMEPYVTLILSNFAI